jgi:hypothetical protein
MAPSHTWQKRMSRFFESAAILLDSRRGLVNSLYQRRRHPVSSCAEEIGKSGTSSVLPAGDKPISLKKPSASLSWTTHHVMFKPIEASFNQGGGPVNGGDDRKPTR